MGFYMAHNKKGSFKMIIKKNILLKITLFFIILAMFSGCDKWKVIATTPKFCDLNSIWFKGSTGLLFCGYQKSESRDVNERFYATQAIIFKTYDLGKNWKKVFTGRTYFEGSSACKNGKIYAFGRQYDKKGDWKPFLVCTKNQGKTWSLKNFLSARIIGADFTSPEIFYAWSKKSIYRFKGDAKNWEKIVNIPYKEPCNYVGKGDGLGNLWFGHGNWLALITANDKIMEQTFPLKHEIDAMTVDDDGNLWVVERDRREKDWKATLHRRKREKGENITHSRGLSFMAVFPEFFAQSILVYGKKVVVMGSDMKPRTPRNEVWFSDDSGQNWETENVQHTFHLLTHIFGDFSNGPSFLDKKSGAVYFDGTRDRLWQRVLKD